MTMTHDTQTSNYLGGWMPPHLITAIRSEASAKVLAGEFTATQADSYVAEKIAFQLGILPADVARVLAMPAPT